MAKINLRELKPQGIVNEMRGIKVLCYGSNSCGKTYQAAHLEKPLLLMTEAGGTAVNCPKVPITKWATFKDIVNQLTSEKVDRDDKDNRLEWQTMQDQYLTIIIDTAENLIDLAEKAVCVEFGVRDLSEIEDSRKNGWAIYRKDFKSQIDKLCLYGYNVVFIGHEEYVDHVDDNGEKYQYIQPKGSENVKSSTRFLRDLCDFCIFLRSNGVDENDNVVLSTAYCKETKYFFARSRFPFMCGKIEPFTAKNLTEAILKAMRDTAESEGLESVAWEKKDDGYTIKEWLEMIQPYYKAIYKKHPDWVRDMVANELGEGRKISSATDEDKTQLENIYNQMVTFASDQQIKVDD